MMSLSQKANAWWKSASELSRVRDLSGRLKQFRERRLLLASSYFDARFYLENEPDVRDAGVDPAGHYLASGWLEGRDPSAGFSTTLYLSEHPECLSTGLNPLLRFLRSPPSEQESFIRLQDRLRGKAAQSEDPGNWPIGAVRSYPESESSEFVKWVKSVELAAEPLVSVVMPTWNREMSVAAAIESVRTQSYSNWQLHVVDDGSTDGTLDAVAPFLSDSRISLHQTAHLGASSARNEGLRHARGSYVAYLDSDNTWTPHYLEYMIRALETREAECGYAILCRIRDDGVRYLAQRFNRPLLLQRNYVDLNVFIHRRDLYDRLGGFDERLFRGIDWDLALRYTSSTDALYCPFLGCRYDDAPTSQRISVGEASQFYPVMYKHSQELLDWPRLRSGCVNRNPNLVSILLYADGPFEQILAATRCLTERTHHCYELIIVDPRQDPTRSKRLQRLSDNLAHTSLRIPKHPSVGRALGLSLGFAASRGGYVAIAHPAIRANEGWLSPLVRALEENIATWIAQAKLGPEEPDDQVLPPRYASSFFGWNSDGSHPVLRPMANAALVGGAYLMRAAQFAEVEGLDPYLPTGGSDLDLCMRIVENLGGTLRIVEQSRATISPNGPAEELSSGDLRLLERRWLRKLGTTAEEKCP